MYAAIELSKYIVTKCIEENHPISNLQLQKILYCIQKQYLLQGSLAFPEDIEAWQFGPVVPVVYYYYCGFGAMPISIQAESIEITESDALIINSIVEEKRKLAPWTLVAETHKVNGAWDRIFQGGVGNHRRIPVELIKEEG